MGRARRPRDLGAAPARPAAAGRPAASGRALPRNRRRPRLRAPTVPARPGGAPPLDPGRSRPTPRVLGRGPPRLLPPVLRAHLLAADPRPSRGPGALAGAALRARGTRVRVGAGRSRPRRQPRPGLLD